MRADAAAHSLGDPAREVEGEHGRWAATQGRMLLVTEWIEQEPRLRLLHARAVILDQEGNAVLRTQHLLDTEGNADPALREAFRSMIDQGSKTLPDTDRIGLCPELGQVSGLEVNGHPPFLQPSGEPADQEEDLGTEFDRLPPDGQGTRTDIENLEYVDERGVDLAQRTPQVSGTALSAICLLIDQSCEAREVLAQLECRRMGEARPLTDFLLGQGIDTRALEHDDQCGERGRCRCDQQCQPCGHDHLSPSPAGTAPRGTTMACIPEGFVCQDRPPPPFGAPAP